MAEPLADVVGAERVAAGEGALDGVPIAARVRPDSAEKLAACLAAASAQGRPVVLVGAGTRLHWGNPARADSLVALETAGLDAPFELDADEGIAHVGAGVAVAELERAAAALGKRTRLVGGSSAARASVGGAVAADPLGIDTTPDSRLRDDLLGLEVALASGQRTRAGGRVVKNVTGFDLVRLYTGSLGTLGAVTAVTLRLRALPAGECVRRLERESLPAALARALELRGAPGAPLAALACREADGRAALWLRGEGPDAALARTAADWGGDAAEPSAWHELRARPGAAPRPGRARVRVSARPSDSPAIAETLGGLLGADALDCALPWLGSVWVEPEEPLLGALLERVAANGWLAFVERASPEAKRALDVFGPPPDALAVMRALKARFDPRGILSPGRFVGRI